MLTARIKSASLPRYVKYASRSTVSLGFGWWQSHYETWAVPTNAEEANRMEFSLISPEQSRAIPGSISTSPHRAQFIIQMLSLTEASQSPGRLPYPQGTSQPCSSALHPFTRTIYYKITYSSHCLITSIPLLLTIFSPTWHHSQPIPSSLKDSTPPVIAGNISIPTKGFKLVFYFINIRVM